MHIVDLVNLIELTTCYVRHAQVHTDEGPHFPIPLLLTNWAVLVLMTRPHLCICEERVQHLTCSHFNRELTPSTMWRASGPPPQRHLNPLSVAHVRGI